MALCSVSGGSVSAGRTRSRAASTAATRSFMYAPRSKVIGARPPGKSLGCRGSPLLVLVERERPRPERAALVPRQELDAFLGLVEILVAAARVTTAHDGSRVML